MLFRRRSKRPIDRVRDSARSAGQTARRTGRKAWNRVQSTQRDVARLMPARRARAERRKRVLFVLGGTAAGAALMALLDPVRGKARRALVRDQTAAFFRRRARRLGRYGRKVGSDFRGYRDRQAYSRSGEYIAPNEVTLEQKVESEVLGRSDVPKGSILINAEDGVIVLRGEVDTQDQIDHVESLVRKVDGVFEVENLLHLKGTPPPNKTAAWETR